MQWQFKKEIDGQTVRAYLIGHRVHFEISDVTGVVHFHLPLEFVNDFARYINQNFSRDSLGEN